MAGAQEAPGGKLRPSWEPLGPSFFLCALLSVSSGLICWRWLDTSTDSLLKVGKLKTAEKLRHEDGGGVRGASVGE